MNAIKISEQISFLRRQKGITQEALAKHLGVTNQTISKWESGQCCPDIQFLPQVADYCGISIDELLGHTSNASLEALCLSLKKYFSELPEKECFDSAYRLAAQLHEIVMTGGYRNNVYWKEKNYAKEPVGHWGLSARSEAEGSSVRNGDLILFTDSRAWSRLKKAELRKLACMLEQYADEKVLKVFFTLQDLTVRDSDRYVSAVEIAESLKMNTDDVERILSELPVTVRENEDEEKYRIDGSAAWIPSVLTLLR